MLCFIGQFGYGYWITEFEHINMANPWPLYIDIDIYQRSLCQSDKMSKTDFYCNTEEWRMEGEGWKVIDYDKGWRMKCVGWVKLEGGPQILFGHVLIREACGAEERSNNFLFNQWDKMSNICRPLAHKCLCIFNYFVIWCKCPSKNMHCMLWLHGFL